MHFNDPTRPKCASGRPAILIDGSALPVVCVDAFDDTSVRLGVMLRNYSLRETHAYSWFNTRIDHGALAAFFRDYAADPELTLKLIFGWEAKPLSPRSHLAKPAQALSVNVVAQVAAMASLL